VTAQLDGYESESSSEMLFTYDKSPEVEYSWNREKPRGKQRY
jgi:hypothetical protein